MIDGESVEIVLQTWEWFMIGALSSIAAFFFIFYFPKKDDKQLLYFAVGCLITIIRIVFFATVNATDPEAAGFLLAAQINYLSFIWGPFLYAILAESLFPSVGISCVRRIFLGIAALISGCILFLPQYETYYNFAFDYIILLFVVYAVYVYLMALARKLQFSIPIFVGNLVFIAGLTHDVLRGSNIIVGLNGEIFQYASLLYAAIMATVLAYRYTQAEKNRLKTQLKFLHAQIQPHFLYNALGTIGVYCKTDPDKAGELLEYLSVYLRGRFRDENDHLICLHDEIDLVKAYLTIEQTRFAGRIAVVYDIEDDCNVLIPSLSLQPLVENAVKHGLLQSREGGTITLSVKKEDDRVVISVKDDGAGMDAQQLRDVLQGNSGGIGIWNTDQRLKRYFGTGIKAVSTPGDGSVFTLTVPLRKGDHRP